MLYFSAGVLTNSCGLLQYDATICDIHFAALHTGFSDDGTEPDRFDNGIGFEIWSYGGSEHCAVPTIQLFNTAYATTKCAVFTNSLVKSTYKIFLDRPIVLDGDTIHANTDLLNIPEIYNSTSITLDEDCKFVMSTIVFKQALVNRMTFETGEYVVTFKCATNDTRNFVKTRRVIFVE